MMLELQGIRRAYLGRLQEPCAALTDVLEGTALGQHQQAGQHDVELAGGGRPRRGGGPGARGRDGPDVLQPPHQLLLDVLHGRVTGAGVPAAEAVPAAHGFLVLQVHDGEGALLCFCDFLSGGD